MIQLKNLSNMLVKIVPSIYETNSLLIKSKIANENRFTYRLNQNNDDKMT